MTKCKLYVSISDQRIYTHSTDSHWEYEIEIERPYIPIFKSLFDQMQLLEVDNFFRAHLPYIPYHYDKENDALDNRLYKVYALIHEFADRDTQKFIEKLPYFQR